MYAFVRNTQIRNAPVHARSGPVCCHPAKHGHSETVLVKHDFYYSILLPQYTIVEQSSTVFHKYTIVYFFHKCTDDKCETAYSKGTVQTVCTDTLFTDIRNAKRTLGLIGPEAVRG